MTLVSRQTDRQTGRSIRTYAINKAVMFTEKQHHKHKHHSIPELATVPAKRYR